MSALRTRCRRLKRTKGLALVVVDYLQLMRPSIGTKPESRVLERNGNHLRIVQKGEAKHGPVSFAFENVRDVVLIPPREIRTRLVSGSLKSAHSVTRIERTDTGLRLLPM